MPSFREISFSPLLPPLVQSQKRVSGDHLIPVTRKGLNKAPFVFQSQPVQVKQLLLACIQHNYATINYY